MNKTAIYLLLIAVVLLLLYFVLIIYVWFFRYFSEITTKKVKSQLEKIVSSFFTKAVEKGNIIGDISEVEELNSFIKNSASRKEALIDILINYGDDFIESNHDLLTKLYQKVGIRTFLIKRLDSRSFFIKALTCRQLGALKVKGTEAYILKLSSYNDNDVKYNVLLALAKLGDINGIVAITKNSDKVNISYRAVIEIISAFNGSKDDLFVKTLPYADDYIKGILIKAAADYKIEVLRYYYLKYLQYDDKNIKIACIRALCSLKDSDNEIHIINMLEDVDWEVRAAAAKGLENIGTSNSFIALAKTTGDSEWWVRHNAACTLILLQGGVNYASGIIHGEDKYASEAVASALETLN
ncbi:HEAT repeat domain-containing protein [Clostridium sp.]|uniref:HEAT repeat domain-containing protein n=1 Tax=Clostridium sp. TaxID=1506 RepID=UPI003D6D44A8